MACRRARAMLGNEDRGPQRPERVRLTRPDMGVTIATPWLLTKDWAKLVASIDGKKNRAVGSCVDLVTRLNR